MIKNHPAAKLDIYLYFFTFPQIFTAATIPQSAKADSSLCTREALKEAIFHVSAKLHCGNNPSVTPYGVPPPFS
jgi:hypothetical protein